MAVVNNLGTQIVQRTRFLERGITLYLNSHMEKHL